jgi:C1A family cysteine protease
MITRDLTLMLIVALLVEAKQNLNSPDVIKIVNSANQGWRAGQIKKFDNATSEDTSLLLGLLPETPNPSLIRNPNRKRATNAVTLPEYFDARSKWPKCTQPVRSQDSCGCCWAFAS